MCSSDLTCGDEFVMNACAYTTPVEGTFEAAEGVVLDAPRYFFVECMKHADADDNFVCDNCENPCNDGCELTAHVDADDTKTCDVCGFDFEDGCDIHPNVNYTTIKVATLFSEGERSGVCADCGKDMGTEVVGKTKYDVGEFNSSTSGTYVIKKNIKNDVLKGKHFYPTEDNPEGNDLLVEFTFNYNETLANMGKNAYIGIASLRKTSNGSDDITPFWLNFADNVSGQWCPEAGGFESCGGATALEGPDCTKKASEGGVFPNIGGYGWHRIGVRIHQDAAIVDGEVKYTVTATLYVDGAVLSVLDISEAMAGKSGNYLFTAEIVDGELVYSDDHLSGRDIYTYRIGQKQSPDGTAIYLDAD